MQKLYILCGIPFSGKSTLAQTIVKKFGFTRIDLDQIKFELYGNDAKDQLLVQTNWDIIYQKMYKKIEDTLKEGKTVLHDTGNFTKYERSLVKQIADKLDIPINTIYINIPESAAYERLLKNRRTKERFDVSDEDFKSTVAEIEPPTQGENPLVFNYDDSIEEWIQDNIN